MLILSRKDILSVFSMRDAIEADKRAFILHSRGQSVVPLRANLETESGSGQYLFMPAYAGGDIDRAGLKVVSVFPGNADMGLPVVPATVLLADGQTGMICALLEGTVLTQLRTAAVSGAATELLARPDATVAALFGTGGQGPSQLRALLTVRPLREVRVFDIDPQRTASFVETHGAEVTEMGARLIATSSAQEAVDGADVITSVTTSPKPVFQAEWLKTGVHVNGVGSYTPAMQELPAELLHKANRVFVDNREAVLSEVGDFLNPIKEGLFTEDRVDGELGELLLGKVPGRRSPQETTVMKTVGFATLDVVAAHEIYEKALAHGVGKMVEL